MRHDVIALPDKCVLANVIIEGAEEFARIFCF